MAGPTKKERAPAGIPRSFGSPAPAPGLGAGFGGFGGFETATSKSGLAYLSERYDPSAISDANAVVAFKTLVKKDSTTKARALEELLAYVQAHPYGQGGVEDAVLDAWVHFYPRLSIDEARKVRELAHTLQFELMKSARRRMDKRIPRIVGPWLAGTYDRDRGVAKAAADGLASFLTTDEKAVLFWKRLQPHILGFATAALQETPTTLSDMRSSSKEDADLKYARVVYSALSLVLALLEKLDAAELDKERAGYEAFFAVEATWTSAVAADSHVRRAAFKLYGHCLEMQSAVFAEQLPRFSKLMTREAPKSSQAGSVADYVRVLTLLTRAHPDIWSGGKKHPFASLRPLIEAGSQGTPATAATSFWLQLDALFGAIPPQEIALPAAYDVLASFRAGVSRRDEPRSNAVDAWTAYLSMVRRLVDVVAPADGRVALVEAGVYTLLDQYIATPATTPASTPASSSAWATGAHTSVLTRACLLCSRPAYPDIVQSFRDKWTALSTAFSGRLANSLPEVSQNYQKSQHAIAAEGDRWMALVADIHVFVQQRAPSPAAAASGSPTTNLAEDVVAAPTVRLLESAVDVLTRRNYKPFGAAQLLSAAFAKAPHVLRADGLKLVQQLFPIDGSDDDAEDRLAVLLASPSVASLLSCLRSMAAVPGIGNEQFATLFEAIVSRLLQTKDANPEETSRNIGLLVADAPPTVQQVSQRSDALQAYLSEVFLQTAKGSLSAWGLVDTALASHLLTPARGETLARELVGLLETKADVDEKSVLTVLDSIAKKAPQYLQGQQNTALVDGLLRLSESHDAVVSEKALALHKHIASTLMKDELPQLDIISRNLESADPSSLEIDSLLREVAVLADALSLEEKQDLFPSTIVWMDNLRPFLEDRQPSGMGGLSILLPGRAKTAANQVKRDRHGHSVPARMAAYTLKLIGEQDGRLLAELPQPFQVELVYALYLVDTLGLEQIDRTDAHSFWGDLSDAATLEVAQVAVTDISTVMIELIQAQDAAFVRALVDTMLGQTRQIDTLALATAQALAAVLQDQVASCPLSAEDKDRVEQLDLWKPPAASPATVLGAAAVLEGYAGALAESKAVSLLCNRLVSDVAGARADAVDRTLATLVVLNACLGVFAGDGRALPVASNRVVFAVKQITSWLADDKAATAMDGRIAAESCRALTRLLPAIGDVYGEHWERSLQFCLGLWARAPGETNNGSEPGREAYIYWSLRLVSALEGLSEPNDDLVDALAAVGEAKADGLLALCRLPRTTGRQTHTQQAIDSLLSERVRALSLPQIADVAALYGLVASASRAVQTAGFALLHRALPAQQAEYSLTVILEKKEGRLPAELVSLLRDAPTLDAFADDVALAAFPAAVREYLLAWLLVFDAVAAASAKVRGHYAAQLAEGGHVAAFLDFAVDVLGHSAAHPLLLDKERLDREHIRAYDPSEAAAGDLERDMHWLLVHLYYLVLKYVPGPFKAWYAGCRSKQTKVAVEAWTARWFSELVVQDVLDEVEAWGAEQEEEGGGGVGGDDEETELEIKVSRAAREVVAGYAVEDQQASVAIRLPANYPIDAVTVVGMNRVAVSERKWQSWLMITQGVIAFSNGSVVDGLATFRRNVMGALRGQSECAICYSIISADRKTPDKRCGTCRNLFHRTCLYKWFQTSNQNTCPLCRNPISFLGEGGRRGRAEN